MQERVLIVPTKSFHRIGRFDGLSRQLDTYVPLLRETSFLEKDLAEIDESKKQIIVYGMLTHGNQIYRYRRGKAGEESRLHGKRSVGIGGHVNDTDVFADDLRGRDVDAKVMARIIQAFVREVQEETGLMCCEESVVRLGWINEDDTAVGRVHLGLLLRLEVTRAAINEFNPSSEIVDPAFVSFEQVRLDADECELWSQYAISAL